MKNILSFIDNRNMYERMPYLFMKYNITQISSSDLCRYSTDRGHRYCSNLIQDAVLKFGNKQNLYSSKSLTAKNFNSLLHNQDTCLLRWHNLYCRILQQ